MLNNYIRKISVVTGTRADYGLLHGVINGVHKDKKLSLKLIVSCMHLSPEFGLTVKEIEEEGFPISEKVVMLLSSDTPEAISTSMGLGMIGFAKAYERLSPDIIVVLGDRFETLAAAAAAVPFGIPVAHIHGGETTEGTMDELFRHAITKMSHIHFPATETYAKRIIQMGEQSENVICVGAPGLDNITRLHLLGKRELEKKLELPKGEPLGVLTFHPETLGTLSFEEQINTLLSVIDNIPEIFWIFTSPNADTGSRKIFQIITDYVSKRANKCKLFISLGQTNYLSLLRNSQVMVGNSSSGIIEAPSFRLPVVNVGDRQRGRVRAANVLDVPLNEKDKIVEAIRKAISIEFRNSLEDIENPYGDGHSSERIVDVIKSVSLDKFLVRKPFNDHQNEIK